ncbi:hypothetical protein BGZ83_003710 [Gryganskiella cystojenkinii]|nr:hypothetical protein BGZ83_003710 [Gryganskiella cystojenkinii]
MTVSQRTITSDSDSPKVLIIGAGIAGLFLAIMLDKAEIDFEIFERAPVVKPLGSIMALHHSVMPVMEQVGLFDELRAIALPGRSHDSRIFFDDMTVIAEIPKIYERLDLGYEALLLPRPDLYGLFLSKVAKEKIHFGKRVIATTDNEEGVTIECADGTTYQGDILAGADGAYSGVRGLLYEKLKKINKLPPSDAEDLNKGYIALVGTTDPLDPKAFPIITREDSTFSQVIGRGTSYNWSCFNVNGGKICWVVVQQLASLSKSEANRLRHSTERPGRAANAEMIEAVKDFPVPVGDTIGNLIQLTNQDSISKVYFEDKMFETWNHGRTVLVGDAAHKLLPSAGQGAVCAILDAVILANCLYELKSTSHASIEEALQSYKEQRYPHVKEQFHASEMNAIILYGQTLKERLIRYIALNWVPQWAVDKATVKGTAYRPQATFLPFVPKRGSSEVLPQTPSKKFLEEQKKKVAASATLVV